MFYVAIELFSALGTSNSQVAHFAHLGGMLFGFLLIRYWRKHPGLSGDFGINNGQAFLDKMRQNWEQRRNKSATPPQYEEPISTEDNRENSAKKEREQDEIDIILDKIRKSGYDSLTDEEKKKLFDASNRK